MRSRVILATALLAVSIVGWLSKESEDTGFLVKATRAKEHFVVEMSRQSSAEKQVPDQLIVFIRSYPSEKLIRKDSMGFYGERGGTSKKYVAKDLLEKVEGGDKFLQIEVFAGVRDDPNVGFASSFRKIFKIEK